MRSPPHHLLGRRRPDRPGQRLPVLQLPPPGPQPRMGRRDGRRRHPRSHPTSADRSPRSAATPRTLQTPTKARLSCQLCRHPWLGLGGGRLTAGGMAVEWHGPSNGWRRVPCRGSARPSADGLGPPGWRGPCSVAPLSALGRGEVIGREHRKDLVIGQVHRFKGELCNSGRFGECASPGKIRVGHCRAAWS